MTNPTDPHTFQGRPIRGLTLIRPWPWAFTHADKRVENRPWKPPQWMLGGWVALHAGKKFDRDTATAMAAGCFGPMAMGCPQEPDAHVSGAIVALAQVERVFVVEANDPRRVDPWCSGPVCWTFNPWTLNVLREPVPAKGALGLWKLPPSVIDAIEAQWDQRRPSCVDVNGMPYPHCLVTP